MKIVLVLKVSREHIQRVHEPQTNFQVKDHLEFMVMYLA